MPVSMFVIYIMLNTKLLLNSDHSIEAERVLEIMNTLWTEILVFVVPREEKNEFNSSSKVKIRILFKMKKIMIIPKSIQNVGE